jgi:hypothetical protein
MTKRDDKESIDVEMLEYWINLLSFQIHSSLGVLHYKTRQARPRAYDKIPNKRQDID